MISKVLDYLQTMWSQKPVCGLFANNMVSLAAIVGPTSRVFAVNVGRQGLLFAGQPPDNCGPLQLRHGFGVACIEKGIPLNLVQRWLGHAQLSTTAIYADAVGEEERQSAARLWS